MMLAGPILQQYFTKYLIAQRRLSPQTLASYRDTFRLLLQFVQSELKIEPAQLAIEQLDAEIILRFWITWSYSARTPLCPATCDSQPYARSFAW